MSVLQESFSYKWFDRVWNNSQEEAIDLMVDENAIIIGLNDELRGPAGFKTFYHSFRNDFDQIYVTVTSVVALDDGEEVYCNVRAVHKDSGQPVNFNGKCRMKIAGGKIQEAENEFDFAVMTQQIAASANLY